MRADKEFCEVLKSCMSEELKNFIISDYPVMTLQVGGLDYVDLYAILLGIYYEKEYYVQHMIQKGYKSYWCELGIDKLGLFYTRATGEENLSEFNYNKLNTYYSHVSYFVEDMKQSSSQTEILTR